MKQYLKILPFISFAFIVSCEKDPPILELKPSEFQKNFGGTNDEFGKAVVEYSNGDLYVVGSTTSFGAGQKDVYVIKTDKNGNKIWAKTFGGVGNEDANEVIVAADGNLLIVGTTDSYGAGVDDIYLLKIDTTGAQIWHKEYGGGDLEVGEDILIAADGNYVITGITGSFGNGLRDIYLLKITTGGTPIWEKTFGGPMDDGGIGLCQAAGGNFMLYNFTDNFGALARDTYVMKVSSTGDSLGAWLYGGDEYEQACSIEPTSDGNFVILGHTASFGHFEHNLYALKITDAGVVLWEKDYGGAFHDGGEHGEQSDDGGYIFCGRTNSFENNIEQVYLVKTDAAGNLQWEKNMGGSDIDAGYNMIETDDAYILVGHTMSTTNGNNDVFLVKILKE